jgi:CCR4-NOT transcription complex subunit 1
MGALPPELQEEVKRVYNAAVTINPKLQGAAAEQGTQSTEAFAGDIEEEANSYFQKIYTSQQSIEDVVQMLKAFKVSSKQREQEIFACMIHNLFDEYRFFPKYPDKELCITAILFGSLIQYQLVVSLTLGIALRYVLDALRKPLGSKMFTFGLEALNQFKTRLPEWPQYCSYILQIPHMRQAQPELVEQLERVVSGVAPLTDPNPAGPNVGPGYGDMPSGPESSFKLGNQMGGGLGANAFGPGVLAQMPMGGHDQSADADQSNEQSAAKVAAPASSVPAGAFSPVPYQPQADVAAARAQAEVAAARSSPAATPAAASPLRKASSNNATLEKSVSFATSLSLDTLMQAESDEPKFPVPDEGTQDKIHFLVNNVSVHNLTQKASQLAHHLTAEYHQWFSQYMVAKRSSIEPNFHMLYLQLLDELKQDRLMRMIVKATVRNIQVLLQSEKIKTNSGERSLLKNLGSWLGQLTIARNKPVLQRDIDPKALILNAYEKGKMIAVIPFVAKMLEACKASKVFRPPNPWLMALLGLLMEMYTEKDLKLNLKFEVEMLFKHLNIAKEDVPPTKLLHKHTRDRTNNSDWAVDKSTLSTVSTAVPAAAVKAIAAVGLLASNAGTPPLPQGPGPVPATPIMPVASAAGAMYPSLLAGSAGGMQATGASAEEAAAAGGGASVAAMVAASAAPLFTASLEQALPNLHMYVHLNPSLALVADQLQLKRLLPLALDRAIREIVAPVVERSVTIACMTTRELVLKDFAMEPDETRMRKAAHLMVCSLAGSLALVTCKEPLRVSIMTQLRQALMQLGGTGAEQLIEQAVQVATADNLDLGCALIEKAATDKALRDVDEALAPSYAVRRKSREAGQAYYDMSVYAQGRYPSSLPEVLRPKPGHLQPVQQRVYEDFARLPRTPPPPPPPMPYGPPPPGGEGAAAGTYPLGAMGQPGGLQQLLGQGLGADAAADDIAEAAMEAAMGMEGEKDESGLSSAVRPAGATDPLGAAAPAGGEPLSTGAVIEKYRACSSRIDFIIAKDPNHASYESLAPELLGQLRAALTEVREILRQAQSTGEASLAVAQKAFKRLYEGPEGSGVHVSVHLLLLESIRDVNQRLTKELTQWVIYSDDARKLHQEITEGLVRARLLNLTEFDSHLAKLMNAGRNQAATDFAAHLVRQCIVAEPLATAADFFSVLDVLGKVAQRAGAPESLATLLEQVSVPLQRARVLAPYGPVPPCTDRGVPLLRRNVMKVGSIRSNLPLVSNFVIGCLSDGGLRASDYGRLATTSRRASKTPYRSVGYDADLRLRSFGN